MDENNYFKILGLSLLGRSLIKPSEYIEQLRKFPEPLALINSEDNSERFQAFISKSCSAAAIFEKKRLLKEWEGRGIQVIAYGEGRYPERLKQIYEPPMVLFFIGNSSALIQSGPTLSVVGSRKADGFGCKFSEASACYMAERGVVIVSGLALGVDASAHHGALESKGESMTCAILGNGLDTLYPSANERLAKRIVEQGGALVSQFLPGEKPYPSNFLARNRIIAGLADATLVIQAPERSGSLATARAALEEGREVLVVPGAVNDPRYGGSNKLIQKGANVILAKEDILEFFPDVKIVDVLSEAKNNAIHINSVQSKLLKILKENKSLHRDEFDLEGVSAAEISQELLQLEISDFIIRLPGNLYTLS